MPTIGCSGLQHLEMGTGALLSYELIPAAARNSFNDPITGPNAIFVRLRTAPTSRRRDSVQTNGRSP